MLGVSHAFVERKIISNFSATVSSPQIIGILGANGIGKSSLFKLINQEYSPNAGEIRFPEHLKIVYFDQHRASLDGNISLRRAMCEHGDHVIFQSRSIHVASWAKKFGFGPERLETPVNKLSGGEQARVLISQLMLQEADLLLLDEPNNDLDIKTLEVLEESLLSFSGSVMLITHDRYMLNRLCDSHWGFIGDGNLSVFASIDQWIAQVKLNSGADIKKPQAKATKEKKSDKKTKKLSYMEQREFDSMEGEIMSLESLLEQLNEEAEAPANRADSEKIQEISAKMQNTQEKIECLMHRWSELEEKLS